jgi:hypothetical protein
MQREFLCNLVLDQSTDGEVIMKEAGEASHHYNLYDVSHTTKMLIPRQADKAPFSLLWGCYCT